VTARPTKKLPRDFMATYEEFTIDQGADIAIELHLQTVDGAKKNLTGYTATAKLKKNYNSDGDDTTDFTTTVATPATDGVVTLSLTNTQTDSLKHGRYVYDVELSYVDSDDNTIIERVLEGKIQVTPSVTR
jgi:hypothetical protein